MPIRHRLIAFPLGRCLPRAYAVLVGISPGYPPVAGRLHTCYSPVRRSPPRCCHPVLPLDLHVLSLSLAFILSQDQTLRCCISCLFFFLFKIVTKLVTDIRLPFIPSTLGDARFIRLPVSEIFSTRTMFSGLSTFPCLSLLSIVSFRNHFKDLLLSFRSFPKASAKLVLFSELPKFSKLFS